MSALIIYGTLVTILLVIACKGNEDVARENRALKAAIVRLSRRVELPRGTEPAFDATLADAVTRGSVPTGFASLGEVVVLDEDAETVRWVRRG